MLKIFLPIFLVLVSTSITLGSIGALIGFVSGYKKHITDSAARPSHDFKDLAHSA